MIYFVSDLDNTIIYSKNNENSECVEFKNDKEITYMTKKAIKLMNKILNDKNIVFIPCTLRSLEQVDRISFLDVNKLPFLICDNGFSIYYNGILDKSWKDKMKKIISFEDNKKLYLKLDEFIQKNKIPIYKLYSSDDAYYTVIFHNADDLNKYYESIIPIVDQSKYRFFIHKRKLYIIPSMLNKKLALEYIIKKNKLKNIITSGDGFVDEDFVKLGSKKIVPLHSTFNTENMIVTKNIGILAGEEILENIYK